MKSVLISILLAAMFALSGAAQGVILKATIPFEFQMGNAVLPSGDYIVQNESNLLRFREVSGKGNGYAITYGQDQSPVRPGRGALVFNKYGGQYFLASVQAPHAKEAHFLPRGRKEVEAAASTADKKKVIVATRMPVRR